MDTRILSLPNAPIDPDSYLEILVPDVSSATGYTSCKIKPVDLASSLTVGAFEVPFGDSIGSITSSPNFKYTSGSAFIKGLDQTSGNMTIQTKDSAGLPMFKVQNNGLSGFRQTTPTAVVHANGIDGTSGNYVAKFRDSSNTPLVDIRNDSQVSVNNPPSSSLVMEVRAFDNTNGIRIWSLNGLASIGLAYSSITTSDTLTVQTGGSTQLNLNPATTNNVAIGNVTATAKLHTKGIDTSSSVFVFKFDDSAGINVVKGRNDGYVIQRAINGAIGDGGLASSEWAAYVDELTDQFIIKVKYSDGTTVKTTSLLLI